MIDSHAHLELLKNKNEIIERAKANGINAIICPASNFSSNEKILELSKKYKNYVFNMLGLDPTFCIKEKEKLGETLKLIKSKPCVAIGEIGLDYYWFKDEKDKKQQKEFFTKQLNVAEELEKPVCIHSRNAINDTLDILKNYKLKTTIHCFSDTVKELEVCLDRKYFIGFDTDCCYKHNKETLIKSCSLSSMLIETDSPYLHPDRKFPNDPTNVRRIVELISKIKDRSFDDVDKTTEKNTIRAFDLPLQHEVDRNV